MGVPLSPVSLERVSDWENLLAAWRNAARGKRGKRGVAAFEHQAADKLLAIQAALRDGTWAPGGFAHFEIHSPKTRLISAAPFADRVVHHALCNVISPVFERLFIADSYANRVGKGTHRAVDRLAGVRGAVPVCVAAGYCEAFPFDRSCGFAGYFGRLY